MYYDIFHKFLVLVVVAALGCMAVGAYVVVGEAEIQASTEIGRAQVIASIIGVGAPATHAYCIVYHPHSLVECMVAHLEKGEKLMEKMDKQVPGQAL